MEEFMGEREGKEVEGLLEVVQGMERGKGRRRTWFRYFPFLLAC